METRTGRTRVAKGKAPSFQFYPGDWLRDTALRTCSVPARGLWIEMMCIMHQGVPYGHLTINGAVIQPEALARMVGCTRREVASWLAELDGAKVFSRSDTGAMFSRRMVQDELTRAKRAAGGNLGGNPALLKVNHKDSSKVNQPPTIDLTPSSSSSSSTFSNTPYPLAGFSHAFGMAWDSWPPARRVKRETAQGAWRDAVARLAFKFDGVHHRAEDWLLERVSAYCKSPRAAGEFCSGIANWLIEGRYDDPPEAWADGGDAVLPAQPPTVAPPVKARIQPADFTK
jgi:hypothetical protein